VDWGYHLLLTTVLLVGGCILCGLGVVGEYVGRIYEQVKARPLYLLKEASPDLLPGVQARPAREHLRYAPPGDAAA
jgi:hypothetical protein